MSEFILPILGPLGIRVTIDTAGLEAWLDRLEERTHQQEPLWSQVGNVMRRSFAESFAAGGRPAWEPLAPATIRKKQAKGLPTRTPKGNIPRRLVQQGQFGPGNILIERGDLRDSWVQKGARGHVEEVSPEGFFIGSQLTLETTVTAQSVKPYHILTKKAQRELSRSGKARARVPLARFHEEGTRHMPARRVGVMQEEDLQAIREAAAAWVLGETASTAGA